MKGLSRQELLAVAVSNISQVFPVFKTASRWLLFAVRHLHPLDQMHPIKLAR
jgi:hypothetical protein